MAKSGSPDASEIVPGPEAFSVIDLPLVVFVRVQTSEPVIFTTVEPSSSVENVPY